MRILLILPRLPFPADDGGKLRAAYVALYLAQHHEVALACFAKDGESQLESTEFSSRFWDFKVVPPPAPVSQLQNWLSPTPSDVQELHSAEMVRHIDALMSRFSPDVLLVGEPALTPYVIPYPDRVRILDYICVATLQFERLQALSSKRWQILWRLRQLKFAAYLRRIACHYDSCIVNSEEDRTALRATGTAWDRVEIIPNGLDFANYPIGLASPRPDTLVFHGSPAYPPNLDAVKYFIHEILPLVRVKTPDVKFLVTGRIPNDGSAPEGPGIVYTGYVPDIRPVIAEAWACPVPLRAGAGGTRFKTLEALALGTPMISTAIGAEGLAVTDGVNILMAEKPAEFAAQTVKVLQSPELREQLSVAGRQLVERQYNWECLGAQLTTLMDELLSRKRAQKR